MDAAQSGAAPNGLSPGKRTLVEDHDAGGPEPGPIAQPSGARPGGEPTGGDAHDVPHPSVLTEAASSLTTATTAPPANHADAAPQPGAPQPDSFAGTEDTKGKEKDRYTHYGKGDKKQYGWDLGGTHGVKNSGGAAGAAVYAVSNVEGRYDSVQTYDAGILSFGIMQWTLHAGSLQKFLGYLKDRSGPEGKAAFQADFIDKGIDVKPSGGEYQLVYNGVEYPLGAKGKGKAEIDKLVRQDPDTARKWSEIFHAAGADPRVQKAQFERSKQMFHEAEGIKFGDKIVDQSLDACKKTFHAKYRDQYGKAEAWMSASPKAAALYFSMRVNNPKYANAAFLKAIDAFYDAHGIDRTKWPATWGQAFGELVAEKSKETLSNWNTHDGNEGRVDKTLRFWNKANEHATPGEAPAAPTAATVAAAPPAHEHPHEHAPAPSHHARTSPVPTRATTHPDAAAHHVAPPAAHHVAPPAAQPAHATQPPAGGGGGKAFDKVYKLDGLPTVHAYAPPGGVKGDVEVFLFLHGMYAHHGGDPTPEKDMHLAQAMAQTGRNLVAMAPSAAMSGEWPMWKNLEDGKSYTDMIKQTLSKLGSDLKVTPELAVRSVSLAGHSAGGSALGGVAAELGDKLHDITMQDGGYGGKNFTPSHKKLVEWLLSGHASKLLRVIVRGNIDKRGEGSVLHSHINAEHIQAVATELKKPATVTSEPGDHDARTGGKGMYLHHSLRIDGLEGGRQVLVYNMPDATHWDVRNRTTDKLITEGADTQFAAHDVAAAPPASHVDPAPAATKAPPEAARSSIEPRRPSAPLPPGGMPRSSTAPVRPPAAQPAAHAKQAEQDHHVEAVKQLADPARSPTDGAAFHDGGADKELGAGDEVIEQVDNLNHIKSVFPATPDGMVMAAMYELHRGDKRSMAEIMADHGKTRWQQGKDHAVEQTAGGDWKKGRGLNDDGDATKHGQVVGHVDLRRGGKGAKKGELIKANSPIGPIQAYKTAAEMGTFSQGKDPMWCGAFVSYCLARCGIDVSSLSYVPSIAGKIAKHKGTLFSFETTMTDDGGGDRHKAKYSYGGSYSEGTPGAKESKLTQKKLESAETIDIRPGDIFYSAKHTGIIVGVNKQKDSIVLRTIEGNSNDAVVSNVKTIEVKNGVVTSAPFGGWGRAAQFGGLVEPDNETWVDVEKGKKHHDEGKTT